MTTMVSDTTWEEDGDRQGARVSGDPGSTLVVDLDGFAGPIDLLLSLARDQKVDLARISILQLAEQYLGYISRAQRLRLEIAADYLVMAAWLAYLKSRLLLPPEEQQQQEEPSGEDLAGALRFQLQRLESMRDSAVRLMARPLLGEVVYARGEPETFGYDVDNVYDVSLFDLLTSYGAMVRRAEQSTLHIEPSDMFTVEQSVRRLREMLGNVPDWATLFSFLPPELAGEVRMSPLRRRSAVASTFVASLEMVKDGRLAIRQANAFGPIYLRRTDKQ
ncbi:MAG: ScpA family protein [Acetobacterales bacterium]